MRAVRRLSFALSALTLIVLSASCAEIAGIEKGELVKEKACDDSSPSSCESATVLAYCDGLTSTYTTMTCTLACNLAGQASGPCEGSQCECGDPLSPECYQGTYNYCNCYGCSEDLALGLYVGCYHSIGEATPIIGDCWRKHDDCSEGEEICGAVNEADYDGY